MKRSSLAFYLCLLLASLALAYITWVQEPKKPGGAGSVLRCKKGDIQKLTYRAEDRTVRFEKRKSRYSEESAWWVVSERIPEPSTVGRDSPAEEGGQEAGTADLAEEGEGTTASEEAGLEEERASEVGPVIEVFKANDRLEEEFSRFCPWEALRSLGRPAEEKLAEFGLVDSVESLNVNLGQGVRTFRLGAATFGPKDRYVEDEQTGEVFLVAGQTIRDLLNPKSRFMERSLHTFRDKEVTRVKLRSPEKEKELVHVLSEAGKEQGWADSRSPEETRDLYRNWIRKLFTLRPTEYVPPRDGEEEAGCIAPPDASQELTLTFYGPTKEIGFLTVYRGTGKKGEETYYACSEHTEIVVEVPKSQAETVLKDVGDVLAD